MKTNIPFIVILLLFLSHSLNSQSWTKVQLLDSANHSLGLSTNWLQGGVFFQDTGIIISYHGDIIKSTDYFNSFTIDSSHDTAIFASLTFSDYGTGYIIGSMQGNILKTVDGGNSWNYLVNNLQTGNLDYSWMLQFITPDTGFFSSYTSNNISTTTNGGITWTNRDSSTLPVLGGVLRIQVIHDSIMYVLLSGVPFTLIRSSDYGHTWQIISTITNIDVYGDFHLLDDTTIILSRDGAILKSVNGGLTFDTVMLIDDGYSALYPQQAIIFSGRDTGFVMFGHSVFQTYDAGNSWVSTNFSFSPEDSSNTIHFITLACGQNVVLGCFNGDIYKMDGGCGVSGIQDVPDANSFSLYPNPATTKLYGTINYPQKSTIQILAIDGREVMPPMAIQQNHFEIDIANLAAGLYFLALQNEEGRVVRRFVKE